jgi:hypothetical protein
MYVLQMCLRVCTKMNDKKNVASIYQDIVSEKKEKEVKNIY